MAKARSPAYPAIGLKEAVEGVARIYKEDYQNPISREVAAKHMGYTGLNGKSLGALSALLKYGLLEGRGAETKVSNCAVQIIAHEPGSSFRVDALKEAMTAPELFVDLDLRFDGGKASDQAIRAYLLMQKFIPSAADNAIRSYRDTKALLTTELQAYNASNETTPDSPVREPERSKMQGSSVYQSEKTPATVASKEVPLSIGLRKEVFGLDEGDVVITFPENISAASFDDLKSYLDLFIKKMQRRAKGTHPLKALSNVGPDADRLPDDYQKDE